jgi:hypothetical protein
MPYAEQLSNPDNPFGPCGNGQNMNRETREETIRRVREAAINAWIYRMDDGAWVAATLGRLRHPCQLAQRGGGCVL